MGCAIRGKLKYVTPFTDVRGKRRWRFRRGSFSAYLPDPNVDWEGHLEAYQQALRGCGQATPAKREDTILSLWAQYRASAEWQVKRASTKATYRGWIEAICKDYGTFRYSALRRNHIMADLDKLAATPSARNNRLRAYRQLFGFAIDRELVTQDPTDKIKMLKTKGGIKDWPDHLIEQYQKYWQIGTPQRLAFDLALYTAQRRSDLVGMTDFALSKRKLYVVQQKTGVKLTLPIIDALAASIEATPRKSQYLIETNQGTPRSAKAFGGWFRKACDAAGIPTGYSIHGLRKSAARRLAEAQATNSEIKAITGHVTDGEVNRYTKARDQESLAEKAVSRNEKSQKEEQEQNEKLSNE